MTDPPSNIRARQADQVLELTWPEGAIDELAYKHMRASCPCAACQDEWTGARILDPATIPADIRLDGMEMVGSYAVRLGWSDGHSSGLYTWETLRRLAEGGASGAGPMTPP